MSSIQFYDWLIRAKRERKIKGEVYKKARTDGKTHAEAREEANKAVSALENENPNLKVAHDDQRPIANQESSTGINTSELLKLLEYTRAREAQSSASREAFSITSDIREKAEAFAREHPTFAKWGGYALKGIGAAAMAGTLITAAQVGLGAFVVAGTSMAATDQAMAAVIENGTEAFVEYAASHGTNEAEAKKFADTAVWTVEMLLTGAATVGVTKFIKNSGAVVTKLGAIKSNISTLSRSAFQRTQASATKIDTVSAQRIIASTESNPYIRHEIERLATISESEIVSRAVAMPGEWSGQFKLIQEIPNVATGTEVASHVYSKQVLFKDPRTDQMFRAFQRNDIDPNYVVRSGKKAGMTNMELMRDGFAPYTSSGKQVIIHHMGQSAYGPFVEVIDTTHLPLFHNQFGYGQPHPTAPVIRSEFNPIREAYWRAYAESFK